MAFNSDRTTMRILIWEVSHNHDLPRRGKISSLAKMGAMKNDGFILNSYSRIWVASMGIFALFIMFFFNAGCSNVKGIKSGQAHANAPDTERLEGSEWRLDELGGSPVSLPAGERWPSITFDGAKKQASGFNGCNNFFSDYNLDGSSLEFGPVGATRRFCEGTAGEVEMKFMQALEKTRSWEIRDGLLMLLDGSDILARFTAFHEGGGETDLDSMTFLSEWFPSGKITLSHGEHREPAAPGSASEIVVKLTDKRVFGMISGRETGAVVLVTDSAGSGTFYDLALLTKVSGKWVNTDTVLLGDRVKVHSVELIDDHIIVPITTHGPDDPMCCPAREIVKRFTVMENKLVPVTGAPSATPVPAIIGMRWKWVQTIYNNDTKTIPDEPDLYTLTLHPDGTVDVRADCNRGGGTYVKKGSSISLNITHTTMAMCPRGSLEGEFLRDLAAAATYFMAEGDLYIDLKFDTGTMKFSKL